MIWQKIREAGHKEGRKLWVVKCGNCGIEKVYKQDYLVRVKRKKSVCSNCFGMPKGQAGLNQLLLSYQHHAKDAGRVFALTKADFAILTQGSCFYCGEAPSGISKGNRYKKRISTWGDYVFNGIDRVDNSIGYVIENVVSCCKVCNHMKHQMSHDAFCSHLQRITRHLYRLI